MMTISNLLAGRANGRRPAGHDGTSTAPLLQFFVVVSDNYYFCEHTMATRTCLLYRRKHIDIRMYLLETVM